MIKFKNGDIIKENAQALVNTVNCVGVMGRGIALQFKNAFPHNYKAYALACKDELLQPGQMFVYDTNEFTNPRYIINFPTKRHWRGKSNIEDIKKGLTDLVNVIEKYNITSIAIPPLGSGLGGLNWYEVKPIIVAAMESLTNVEVIIFEPGGAPHSDTMVHSREVPAMKPGRAALIGLMNRYLEGLLDPFITLLELHKLMYFMQAAGEELKLKYQKAKYGPYAENLRHVLNAIEGHFISGYADGGDNPFKQIKLVPGAVEDASEYLKLYPETRKHFDKVTKLVEGFESPFGLELLSTVHWVITNESAVSFQQIEAKVYNWNKHKQDFTSRQIKLAINVLYNQDWVTTNG